MDGKRRIIPSLFLSQLATRPSEILTGFVLIDIGLTFGQPVGVMGQMFTAASTAAMVTALFMSVLSVRYSHRSLFIVGLGLILSSALGCFIASNYMVMLIAYSLNGVGVIMVASMVLALVGEHLPVERRSSAIGLIMGSTPILSVITGLTIGIITSGGWRLAYLGYVFPISLLSLIAANIGMPRSAQGHGSETIRGSILEAFKKVFSNRSGIACLTGIMLLMVTCTGIMYYGISFFRQKFSMPTEWAGIIWSGLALCYFSGSIASGKLVGRFGRKNITLLSVLLIGLFTVFYTNVPDLWLSISLALLILLFAGSGFSAAYSLCLEQVPEYRGTMMSLNIGFERLGSAIGSGIGGLILLQYDWGILGIVLGGMGLCSTLIYHLFAIDPTIERSNSAVIS